MKTISSDSTKKSIGSNVHVFEAAGLGIAPFRFVRFEVKTYQACHGAPIQPGTTCDFCGTAIINVFWIKGQDGHEFKVGCDCVEKTGDAGLRKVVDAVVKAHQKALRDARDGVKMDQLQELLNKQGVQETLENQPHPMGFTGKSAWDYVTWMKMNAGVSGKKRVLAFVIKATTNT